MKTFFLKASIVAISASTILTTSAQALGVIDPLDVPGSDIEMLEGGLHNKSYTAPPFDMTATIGIARLDNGRLIAAPHTELEDWHFLNKRTEPNFKPISVSAHLNNIPEVSFDGNDSYNTLDEIRLTASDSGMDYVLVYGMGADAEIGSFGYRFLDETGFIMRSKDINDVVYEKAKAKAMLVDTYNGTVYGSVTADDVEFGVGELTDKVEALIETLSAYGLTSA